MRGVSTLCRNTTSHEGEKLSASKNAVNKYAAPSKPKVSEDDAVIAPLPFASPSEFCWVLLSCSVFGATTTFCLVASQQVSAKFAILGAVGSG